MNDTRCASDADTTVEVSQARLHTAREAIWQLDAMLDMLTREKRLEHECFDLAFAACMPRLRELAAVAMDVATQQESRSIEELREVVYG